MFGFRVKYIIRTPTRARGNVYRNLRCPDQRGPGSRGAAWRVGRGPRNCECDRERDPDSRCVAVSADRNVNLKPPHTQHHQRRREFCVS